jgi:hypothetical protein
LKILLINIDSKIPNLALEKIAEYHIGKGDQLFWDMPLIQADKTYVSCVFTKNKWKAEQWKNKAEIGGSGYSLEITLPLEIEEIKPHINLGFTTRGCIRKCPFCIVPAKEGKIRVVGDLLDLWDGESRDVILMDNNILALPEHFEKICKQAQENKIRVDFNQGLDHRLLTPEIVKILKQTPHVEYRFAFDHPSYLPTVDKAITMLQAEGINRCTWYVLVGFNTTFDEDLERVNYLKSRNQNAFVQRYETCYNKTAYSLLARWANQHHIFHTYTWREFLEHPKHRKQATENCLI